MPLSPLDDAIANNALIKLDENNGQKYDNHGSRRLKIREIHGEFTAQIQGHIMFIKTSHWRAVSVPDAIYEWKLVSNKITSLSKHNMQTVWKK